MRIRDWSSDVCSSDLAQDRRLIERLEKPWKRWKTGPDDYRNRERRADYLGAMHDMFARTDTRWAPWTIIDGNDQKAARIAALSTIADRLEANVDRKSTRLNSSH